MVKDVGHDAWIQGVFPSINSAYRLDKFIRLGVFQLIGRGSRLDGGNHIAFVRIACQRYDFDRRIFFFIRLVASIPSISGIDKSINTMSASRFRKTSSASIPVDAPPTTSKSLFVLKKTRGLF